MQGKHRFLSKCNTNHFPFSIIVFVLQTYFENTVSSTRKVGGNGLSSNVSVIYYMVYLLIQLTEIKNNHSENTSFVRRKGQQRGSQQLTLVVLAGAIQGSTWHFWAPSWGAQGTETPPKQLFYVGKIWPGPKFISLLTAKSDAFYIWENNTLKQNKGPLRDQR